MARINVDQKALTDPRFYRLGCQLGAEPEFAQAVGLHVMILVWSECTQRVTHILDGWMLQAVTKKTNGHELIVAADLAVTLAGNRFRIRGAKERCLYLKESQERARKNGLKGGRPRKPTLVSVETEVESSSPTPTLTLTLTQNSETTLAPSSAKAQPTKPPVRHQVLVFPCTGLKDTWHLYLDQVNEWSKLYPTVDVQAECQKALAWIKANSKKTHGGMPRFLVNWLNRANDKPSRGSKPSVRETLAEANLRRLGLTGGSDAGK